MLKRDEKGAVYVEFLMSFLPLMFLFTGIVQLGFIYAASIGVQHAAVAAARAAAVVLDDNPSRYEGQERLRVDGGESGGAPEERQLMRLFGERAGGIGRQGSNGSARFSAIRYAAIVPLVPFMPPPEAIVPSGRRASIATDIGILPPEGRIATALLIGRSLLSINFPRTRGGRDFQTQWPRPDGEGNGGQVTARVTFLYMCGIPFANRLTCESGLTLAAGSAAPELGELTAIYLKDGRLDPQEMRALQRQYEWSSRHLEAWREPIEEIRRGPGFDTVRFLYFTTLLNGGGARFVPLRAEATLPVQSANYCYRNQRGGNCWVQNE